MPTVRGTAVAPGLAMGPVHVIRARPDVVPTWTIRGEEIDGEVERLHEAISAAAEQLEQKRKIVLESAGEMDARIFDFHIMILHDPAAREKVDLKIRENRINAEAAVQELIDELNRRLDIADVSDPWRAVLDLLLQRDVESMSATRERVVLAAAELTPEVSTFLERERILAIVAETGGRFSHGAVLARSFGIPCVVGLPNLLARLEQHMQVIVDGDSGTVQLRPDRPEIDEFLIRRRRRTEREHALASHAGEPAVSPDGEKMAVLVNLESIRDLGTFDVNHCDGVGLLRTEFLYMERSQFPSEEEQFRMYRRVLDTMGERPVTFRTLDIGGDKRLPYFNTPNEANPQLGWRGLRITLEWQDLLRVQLRAILRASAHGNVQILLPMVTSLEEVLQVREVFHGVKSQLLEQGYEVAADVPVGVMIEVPSSIWILDQIVEEIDFVSVGTNDLVQYLLAVDRDNPFVAKLYDPHHPAVIRALDHIADVVNRANKPVSVCGEVAGDRAYATMLFGMGYHGLSAAPNFLAELRHAIRVTPYSEARSLADRALVARSHESVRDLLAGVRDRLHDRVLAHEDETLESEPN